MRTAKAATPSKTTRRRGRRLPVPRPFVKWAGGKSQLIDRLLACAPAEFRAYHEPFVGGGAMFFALHRQGMLRGKRVHLSDVNPELITSYLAIRDDVDAVIRRLESHHHDKTHFYRVRDLNPDELAPHEVAARMIYLNKTGFNGLYRVNRSGKFNVPFGRHKNPTICDRNNLLAVADALRDVQLHVESFGSAVRRARAGHLVYFDPPYVPVSDTAYFVSYARNGFGSDDQQRLAEVFARLSNKGVLVMLSNSDTPWVRKAYRDFRKKQVMATRMVNTRADRRGPVPELIVLSYGPARSG